MIPKSFKCPTCKKTFKGKDIKKKVGIRHRPIGGKIVPRIQSRCNICRSLPSKKKPRKPTKKRRSNTRRKSKRSS